jgi:exopolyphosphatase/guanosine-5'-triphosphate,3'-diphosphate pyrophosphatase
MVCDVWEEIEKLINKTNTVDYEEVSIIGSGGNINKLFKMSGKAQEMPFPIYVNLSMLFKSHHIRTKNIRIRFKPRSCRCYGTCYSNFLNAMKWSGARQIYVPKIILIYQKPCT